MQNGERTIGNKIFFSSLPFARRKRKKRNISRQWETACLNFLRLPTTLYVIPCLYPFVVYRERANDNLRDEYRVGEPRSSPAECSWYRSKVHTEATSDQSLAYIPPLSPWLLAHSPENPTRPPTLKWTDC